jgi:hypothetical protein
MPNSLVPFWSQSGPFFRERVWILTHYAALARGLHYFYFLGIPADYREVLLVGRQSHFKNPMLYHLS